MAFGHGDWCRPVNRGRSQADFNNMMVDISLSNIVDGSDLVVFSLSSDNSFSVSVARKHIDDFNSPISLPCTRWFKSIPRKVNIFLWRLFLDKLPHRFNLSARGIDIGSIMCPICNGHVESNFIFSSRALLLHIFGGLHNGVDRIDENI